jgi:hypothetical protein
MRRRSLWIGAAFLGVVLLGLVVAVSAQRKQSFEAAAPPWLDPHQPPRGVAAPLTEAQSFAANRCRPFSASSAGRSAGRRLRRTYPPTLAESATSFVQLGFDVRGSDG